MTLSPPGQDREIEKPFRVFVLSDIHAYTSARTLTEEVSQPSYIDVSQVRNGAGQCPLEGVSKLIQDEKISADLLVCCGDLCDRADVAGIKFVWDKLHAIKAQLGAEQMAVTVGNHDVDSRLQKTSYDPKEQIQTLVPRFPLGEDTHFDRFWSRHFTILDDGNTRIVIANTCAFHGTGDELNHGRLSDFTLKEILQHLKGDGFRKLNILLCHHHPQKHSEYNLGDSDDMQNGQKLLDLLGDEEFGEWIIFHGHKHCPKLSYASGGVASPIVFSAGSISARLYPELGAHVRNQCYLVEFPIDKFKDFGVVGNFVAWDWVNGSGCIPAGEHSGLPHKGGFGNRSNLWKVAAKIAELLPSPGRIKWKDVLDRMPDLAFILPTDLKALKNLLINCHTLKVELSSVGLISEIERG